MSFASTNFDRLAKPTRGAKFLEDMDRILPWQQLCEIVRPRYPTGEGGRPAIDLERMLRILVWRRELAFPVGGVAEGLPTAERHRPERLPDDLEEPRRRSASVYALRIDRLPMQPHSDEPLISIPSDGSDRLIDQLRDLWNDGSDGRVGRAKVELQHGVRRGRVSTQDYSINLELRSAPHGVSLGPRFDNQAFCRAGLSKRRCIGPAREVRRRCSTFDLR